jgi:hypothetical protein
MPQTAMPPELRKRSYTAGKIGLRADNDAHRKTHLQVCILWWTNTKSQSLEWLTAKEIP